MGRQVRSERSEARKQKPRDAEGAARRTAVTGNTTLRRDPRWLALRDRDPAADGRFFYSVKSTGVYCRPSCAARTPLPENVAFHKTAHDAERAGFRPCKRCKPNDRPLKEQQAKDIARLCRFMESVDVMPNLSDLASRAGLSPHHFHRVFKSVTGLTPRAYGAAIRARRVRADLGAGSAVTEAIYNAGYSSSSRFYEKAARQLGMTPRNYRSGGTGVEIRFAVGQCSLGALLVAATSRGVCAIFLGDDPTRLVRDLEHAFPNARVVVSNRTFERLVARVVSCVEYPGTGRDLPLDIRGSTFQHRVWQALQKVPPGTTASYTDIARAIGAPTACRAVARACASNVLAVAIPCHRVVRVNGDLSGYRWGVERKNALLAREKRRDET